MSHSTHPTNAARADSAEHYRPYWFDAHNHLHDPRPGHDPANLVRKMRDAGITGCILNATCENDWIEVANLAETFPDFIIPSFGIHPWKAHNASHGWQDKLRAILHRYPSAGIGECGLDTWVHSPHLDIQIPVFLDHLRIARETGRFLTIHCLKAWGPLFSCLAQEPPPSRFLMHSFGGSIESARRLLPLGAYFSFSGYFLHQRKHATRAVFQALPIDRILLETDAPDMTPPPEFTSNPQPANINHPANLATIGNALAGLLDTPPRLLALQLEKNRLEFLNQSLPI
jgi:TatD DNase family protein